MKNILHEGPSKTLHGRLAYSVYNFMNRDDIVGKSLLDIGCGFGWFEYHTARLGATRLLALDVTDENFANIQKEVDFPALTLVAGTALQLPAADGELDTVVAWEVLEHIDRHQEPAMFGEIARVLRRGGKFYFSTPYRQFWANVFDPAWWLVGHRHYSRATLETLAAEHGFVVRKVAVKAGWISIVDVLNLYVAKWIFRSHPFFQSRFHELMDADYQRPTGFNTIFMELEKR